MVPAEANSQKTSAMGHFDRLSEGGLPAVVRPTLRAPKPVRSIEHGRRPVIQSPKLGSRIMRYELANHEWGAIKPVLPNKPRGVPRLNDRRVNGIFWVLR